MEVEDDSGDVDMQSEASKTINATATNQGVCAVLREYEDSCQAEFIRMQLLPGVVENQAVRLEKFVMEQDLRLWSEMM